LSIGKEGNEDPVESQKRSIAKAVSYRFFGSMITAGIALMLTGKLDVAVGIGLLDAVAKITAFFLHERVWARIRWGVAKRPDYEI
jgi:uncharacterized membrane protein